VADGIVIQAEFDQLGSTHHPVLPGSKLEYRPERRLVDFSAYGPRK
jgi:hypothetical protein